MPPPISSSTSPAVSSETSYSSLMSLPTSSGLPMCSAPGDDQFVSALPPAVPTRIRRTPAASSGEIRIPVRDAATVVAGIASPAFGLGMISYRAGRAAAPFVRRAAATAVNAISSAGAWVKEQTVSAARAAWGGISRSWTWLNQAEIRVTPPQVRLPSISIGNRQQ